MRDMTDVSAAWVARAVEDNEAEFLLALGRAGGGRERDDAEIRWVIGGSPIAYHNCVVRADLEPERADAAITESQNLMRTSGVAGSWHVGPSMRPTDLGTRLEAYGFEGGPEPGMAADFAASERRRFWPISSARSSTRPEPAVSSASSQRDSSSAQTRTRRPIITPAWP
jgi:hypothetical protein